MTSPQPGDVAAIIAELDRAAQQMAAQQAIITEGLAETNGHHDGLEVSVVVAGGQIVELRFTDRADEVSLGTLRERVLTGYRAASGESATKTAALLDSAGGSGFADAVWNLGQSLFGGEVPQDLSRQPPQQPPQVGAAAPTQPADLASILADPRTKDAVVFGTPDDIMADVAEWKTYRAMSSDSDPHRDLEREVAAMVQKSEELGAALAESTTQRESAMMAVIVGPAGSLVDLWFRPGAEAAPSDQLSRDFMSLYSRACREQAATTSDLLGLSDDDPTGTVLNAQLAMLPEATETPAPPPPPSYRQSVDDLDDFVDPTNPFG